MRLCVLGANARFPTEYDSEGYGPVMGLCALLGTHSGSGRSVHVLATVERPALGSTAQLGRHFFHTPQSMTHRLSKLSLTANHCSSPRAHTTFHIHTHTHVCSKSSHTYTLLHTPSFIAHLLSRATFTYNSLTVRSYTISFVLCLSFPCATTSSVLTYYRHNFSHNFHARTLSHTIFHTHLCHTLSFAHNFATHNSSHTTL